MATQGATFYLIFQLAGGESPCLNGIHMAGHFVDQQRDDVLGHIVRHTFNQQKAGFLNQ